MLLRRSTVATAVLAVAATALPWTVATATGAAAAGMPGELVVPVRQVADPLAHAIVAAGPTGYLREVRGGHAWFTYGGLQGTPVPGDELGDLHGLVDDSLVYRSSSTFTFVSVVDGSRKTVTASADDYYLGVLGDSVVFKNGTQKVVLVAPEGSGQRRREVTGLAAESVVGIRSFNTGMLVTQRDAQWKDTHYWVDAATATARLVPGLSDRYTYDGVQKGSDWLIRWNADTRRTEAWDTRGPLTGPTHTYVPYEDPAGIHPERSGAGIVGRDLVGWDDDVLYVISPEDTGHRRLMSGVRGVGFVRDGRVIVMTEQSGRTTLHVVAADTAGKAAVSELASYPTQQFPQTTVRMAMQGGTLQTLDTAPRQTAEVSEYTTSPHGAPTPGTWKTVYADPPVSSGNPDEEPEPFYGTCTPQACADVWPTGTGKFVHVSGEKASTYFRWDNVSVPGYVKGSLRASGRHMAYVRSSQQPQVAVVDLEQRKEIRTHAVPDGAFALFGTALWRETKTAGTVEAVNARTGAPLQTVKVAGCDIREMDAYGSSLYWKCDTESGVYDTGTKTTVRLPAHNRARLGNGAVVLEAGGVLKSVALRGAAATVDLGRPGSPVPEQGWTLDREAGRVAYADGAGAVHIVPLPVAPTEVFLLESEVPAGAELTAGKGWNPVFRLSKPVASWSLELKRKATGTVVRTLTGNVWDGRILAGWDGTDSAGWNVPRGDYTWSLTAKPADGLGSPLTRTGNLAVTGRPVWRDFAGTNGQADLVVLDKDLKARMITGAGKDAYSASTSYGLTGWDPKATFVPFGDLDDDGINDRLVRDRNGVLQAQFAQPGKVVAARSRTVGPGWGQYDVLTSPGDLTGDGRADLIARQTTSGDIYLYAQDGKGAFKPRVRIQLNWKTYKAIVGAGDLNGDGIGEIMAVDGNGTVFRYDGVKTGTVKPRVRASADGWAKGRTAFTVMDIDGAGGKPAGIVTRNAAGDLLFSPAVTGTALLTPGTRFATGYAGFKAIL
ncbi:FG-GAP-like repeat-containing protein [Streptomyces sp. NPDC089799]|uniref:FG-GAP-like repeat-containing protein n=1 Tax=Streptomyces sp. NPDC089799 TaxID=3155066 RepID=UPI00343019C8